jgi:hypothetical protein
LRISPYLLAVMLGAAMPQSIFAKEHGSQHGSQHAKGTAGSAASKGSAPNAARLGSHTGIHAPAATGVGAKGEDAKSPPDQGPVFSTPTANKAPDAGAAVKPKPSGVPPAHPAPITGPANTDLRNAIGLPVVRHDAAPGSSGPHVGTAPPAADIGHAARLGSPSLGSPGAGSGYPLAAQQNPQNPNVGPAARGKISGTGLIRSPVAPATLGGPAKVAAGVNGTTLRSKP